MTWRCGERLGRARLRGGRIGDGYRELGRGLDPRVHGRPRTVGRQHQGDRRGDARRRRRRSDTRMILPWSLGSALIIIEYALPS